jgi:two-component system response regulator AtoC
VLAPSGMTASRSTTIQARSVAPPGVVFSSSMMQHVQSCVRRTAVRPSVSVLIAGETGVGKSTLAEELHRLSTRHGRPACRIECGSLNDPLAQIRALLAAHEAGASPPDSIPETLLLEGVGQLDLRLQDRLHYALDVLERERKTDRRLAPLRFVSVADRCLSSGVREGTFRPQLFFRISGLSIALPPLRERLDEIAPLTEAFLEVVAEEAGFCEVPTLSPDAYARLAEHPWPGNLRELRNVVERATLFWSGLEIRAEHLAFDDTTCGASAEIRSVARSGISEPAYDWAAASERPLSRGELRERQSADERARILAALETCHGNQTRAASLLGMPRRTLVAKLTLHAIPRPRKACGA